MASTEAENSGAAALPTPKAKIELSAAVSKTMLVTLLARADDAGKGKSCLLHDRWASETLERLDYTPKITLMHRGVFAVVVMRGMLLDAWTSEFLAEHTEATVLHLGCGLDSRALRLSWGPRVTWVDVDMPDVISLRKEILPVPPGDYRQIGASVMDESWLDDIPRDRPVLVIMEGLLPYFEEKDARALLSMIVDRFQTGRIIFDAVGSLLIRAQIVNRPIHNTGAVMHWALEDGHELDGIGGKLRLIKQLRSWQLPGRETFPWYLRLSLWIYSWLPGFKTMGTTLRYEF